MLHKIFYSFPIQLLLHHLKRNQVLLLIWILLTAVVTQRLGKYFGIPYLFLDPVYLNQVGFMSLFFMGMSVGGLIMSFHITCYILDGYRFNFLGALSYPFTKFCLNNSLVPLVFVICYLYNFIVYQAKYQQGSTAFLYLAACGFVAGLLCMLALILIYFQYTNDDIFRMLAANVNRRITQGSSLSRFINRQRLALLYQHRILVKYYFDLPLSFKKANYSFNYDKETILKVLDQNQLNAIIVQAATFITFIVLGLFRDYSYVQIPAAASILILLSIVMMLIGALSYWMRGWSVTAVILAVLISGYMMNRETTRPYFRAFGMNYDTTKAEYSMRRLTQLSSDDNYLSDVKHTREILENWKAKFKAAEKKPKMIFICASGGGQRAAVWTMRCLQEIDSLFNGQIMQQTMLMTGASGGMLGAAYFRELYLRKQQGQAIDLYSRQYLHNMAKDRLNPLVFSLIVGDLSLRFQKCRFGDHQYFKDRGYAFERQMHLDTDFMMDKSLAAYRLPEQQALIPMMLVTPTIVNDGRKLYISPQPVSYFTTGSLHDKRNVSTKLKGVEFSRFFVAQQSDSLRFMTALRMNASFPYIMPNVILPSYPAMEVMDTGLLDNFGVSDAVRFLYVFRDWISANTSGVVFICIRDPQKEEEIQKHYDQPFFYKLFSPIENLVTNLNILQDTRNDNEIEYAKTWYQGEIGAVDFQYQHTFSSQQREDIPPVERASLSWRLTNKELEGIKQMINSSFNKKSLRKLSLLLKE